VQALLACLLGAGFACLLAWLLACLLACLLGEPVLCFIVAAEWHGISHKQAGRIKLCMQKPNLPAIAVLSYCVLSLPELVFIQQTSVTAAQLFCLLVLHT
jgi:hypothetical protein